MNWIGQKLELQIIIIKPNLLIQDPKRFGLVALQRIANPIIPGKFEIGMRSRSDPQNIVIFRSLVYSCSKDLEQDGAKVGLCAFVTKLFAANATNNF
jgi:hypothetical protein